MKSQNRDKELQKALDLAIENGDKKLIKDLEKRIKNKTVCKDGKD